MIAAGQYMLSSGSQYLISHSTIRYLALSVARQRVRSIGSAS